MNKLILLGIAATLGAAKLAFFPANPPVDLQPSSPGTAQTGHLNISGTATVGLLKSQGTVFGASTAPTGFAYGGFFTAASNQGRGFYGFASATSGLTYGGFFQNASTSGRAVYGLATATTGNNFGGYFQTASSSGRGVIGVAASSTGTTYGVYGTAVSPSGFGVFSNGNMGASGIISGNGSGLTQLNAANLTGKIYLSGTGNEIIRGDNTDASGFGAGVSGVTDGFGAGVAGLATNNSGSAAGILGNSTATGGQGVFGFATHGTGANFGVYGKTNSPNGYGIYSFGNMHATGVISGNASGLTFLNASNLASGTIDNARLPVPMALSGDLIGPILSVTNTSTFASYGIEVNGGLTAGVYSNGGSTGVFGKGTQKGGDFFASGAGGYGVIGYSNASGATCGVLGDVISTEGTAVWARNFATSGTNYGLRASNDSTGGTAGHFSGKGPDAVFVENTGSGRGLRVNTTLDTAVWAITSSGFAGVDARASNSSSYAIYGFNNSAGTGVVGQSTGGFGLYAVGNTGASGTKSFRIDHPFNPENEYLLHYSSEGPQPLNVYTGNVTTDASGAAWVQLPDYFGEINTDFRYTLTVVDDTDSEQFVMAKVAREIQDNKFKIRTSAPKVKVTWRVEGIRNDLYVRKNGAPVETMKQDWEKGKYQHPELYGKPQEMGIYYRPVEGKGGAQRPRPAADSTAASALRR